MTINCFVPLIECRISTRRHPRPARGIRVSFDAPACQTGANSAVRQTHPGSGIPNTCVLPRHEPLNSVPHQGSPDRLFCPLLPICPRSHFATPWFYFYLRAGSSSCAGGLSLPSEAPYPHSSRETGRNEVSVFRNSAISISDFSVLR